LIGAERWEGLVALVTDYDFVEAKTGAGLPYDLARDYSASGAGVPNDSLDEAAETRLHAWRYFLAGSADELAAGDQPFLQVACNYADAGPVVKVAEGRATEYKGPWLRLVNRPPYVAFPACLRTLSGHTHGVWAVAVTPDGRWVWPARLPPQQTKLLRSGTWRPGSASSTSGGREALWRRWLRTDKGW
jgi:hypothetical protein